MVDCVISDAQSAILAADHGRGEVHRCRITDIKGSAIVVEDNSELTVTDTDVSNVDGVALLVAEKSRPMLTECRIRDTTAQAIVVVKGASAELNRVSVDNARGHAVQVLDGSSVDMAECVITGTQHDAVVASANGLLQMAGCEIAGGASNGIVVDRHAKLSASDCFVIGTAGAGMTATGQARMEIEGGEVRECQTGVLWREQSSGFIVACRVRDNVQDGIVVETDGEVDVDESVRQDAGPSRRPARPKDDAGSAKPGSRGNWDNDEVSALLEELSSLVGLDSVKREVETLVRLIQMSERRAAAGLPSPPMSRHLVFAGSPGTGKTTVARLYGRILAALGVLSTGQLVEVARPDLVAAVVGGTAIKTTEAFNKAIGGVLFIDEAYSLSAGNNGGGGPDFGQEAIDTLVKLMEDHRDEVVVIAAGYEGEMAGFLAANPGLASRFSHRIRFANYTPDELVTIVTQHATKAGYECTGPTVAALRKHLVSVHRGESFGNGRYARQLLDAAITRHARRTRQIKDPTIDDLCVLLPQDIPAPITPSHVAGSKKESMS